MVGLRLGSLLTVGVFLLAGCAGMQPLETQYFQQSRYAELTDYMETQIPDVEAAPTSQLVYLCFSYLKTRNYEKLRPCIRAFQANVDAGDTLLYFFDFSAAPALMRSEMAIDFGDYQTALAEAQTAERLTAGGKSYKQMRIYALSAVALTNALNGERAAAHHWAGELEKISTAYPDTLMATDKAIGLAKAYMALGEYPRALAALQADTSAGFKAFTDVLTGASASGTSLFTYWDLPKSVMTARALLETGDIPGAKAQLDALLAMPQVMENGDLYWIIAYDRGRVAVREGDLDAAVGYFRRAIQEIERQRSTIGSEANRIGFAGDKQSAYAAAVAALVRLQRFGAALEYAERGKARALVDMLASKTAFRGGQTPAEVNRMLAALDAAEAQSLRIAAAESGTTTRALAADARIDRIVSAAPETGSLVSVQTLGLADIQAHLKADEALVEYYFQEGGAIYAFVVDRSGVKAFTADGRDINADVRNFRTAIYAYRSDAWKQWSRRLYDRLIAPLAPSIQGKRHLTIVPHGALHYLPFNALLAPDGKVLIERHTLRLLPSASVMQFLDKPARPTQNLLVFGNPERADAPALPGAEAEAMAVGRLWRDSRVILRAQASETLIKQSAAAFRYIHLASHGQFKPDAPMQSRMLLSADAANDGDLTVSEIYDLDLNADIVTLSACQTGLGDVKNGDDVVGLNRGFLYAGAKAIVSSLWEVPDEPTRELMTTFYKNLQSLDMRTAIQRAQIGAYKRYTHPFLWAAFQMTGGV